MTILTIRNLDPGVKAKVRERAARHGRSMEAEVRAMLAAAVADDAEPTNLAESIRRHFADLPVEIELPDRGPAPREVPFDA